MDSEQIAGKIRIKTEVDVPCEWVSDLLTTAIESGSNWIHDFHALQPTGNYLYDEDELAWEDKSLVIRDDSGSSHALTRRRYLRGLEKYCNDHNQTVEEVYNNHDAAIADDILQLAIYGEVVYG